ncbi:MAG TPA: aldehyde dehydrogenase family protein [Methylomirabilota bacterium]|jgi:acyl-CoA reductase-like NAD-dependent aldehyde dehydrogenase|nr:aldehyde dehydrogenase family protein [Methylomirabilota bacterium]
MGMSYRSAWGYIGELETAAGFRLLERRAGVCSYSTAPSSERWIGRAAGSAARACRARRDGGKLPSVPTRYTLINPATEAPLREVAYTSAAELEGIVAGARAAQRDWRRVPVAERVRACGQMAPAFRAMADQVALDITRQMGKPLQQARNEIATMIDRAETMCRLAESALADEPLPPKDGFARFIRREPLGVVLDIAAWNYPLLIAVNVIVPAVLAGNAVLVKHARLTPLCGSHFAEAFARTGVPPGLVAAVTLDHDAATALIRSGQIDYVSFTGSVAGGREVYGQVAHRFIDAGLELGGKDPAYVCEDANFEFAVENVVDGAFYNAGQSCCGIERVYVARPIYARFVDAAAALVRQYSMGDPEDPATTLGPLAHRKGKDLVEQHVAEARAAGARVLTGGTPWRGPGYFVEPAVLTGIDHSMKVMREETFGPVVGIMPVRDDGEAVRLMNDSPYGLTASIWTEDMDRATRVMAELDAGTVYANRCDYLDPMLPWVGVKDSGKGCSLSHLGFAHLTRPKSFHLRTRTRPA